jgi:hypothetical protein
MIGIVWSMFIQLNTGKAPQYSRNTMVISSQCNGAGIVKTISISQGTKGGLILIKTIKH